MFAIIDRYSDEHFHFIELLVHGDMAVYRKAQQYEDSSWQVQGKDGLWEDEPLFNDIVTDAYDPATVEPDGAPKEQPLEPYDDVMEMPIWLPNKTPAVPTKSTWSAQH